MSSKGEQNKKNSVNWTNEQRDAFSISGCDLLVAAAAGAGKTAVLVERIIRKITDINNPIDIDKLLIVTFTNAAAAEMRERIGDAISAALDKNPKSIQLQKQLSLLHKANITTIHSFCLDVIRKNFHTIEIDPDFRVSDETEALLIKMEALEELFERKYADKNDKDFLNFVECYGSGRDDKVVQDLVLSVYDFVMSYPWPEKWLSDKANAFLIPDGVDLSETFWGRELIKNIKIELLGLKDLIDKALTIINKNVQLFPYYDRFIEDKENILMLIDDCSGKWDNIYNSLHKIDFGKLPPCRNCNDKEEQEKVKYTRDIVKDSIKKIRDEVFIDNSDGVASDLRAMYPLMNTLSELVKEFNNIYTAKKRENGLLDFNDLEHLCLKILTKEGDNQEIIPTETALSYRRQFHEILIDEYQDSNLIQEVIIKAIAGDKNNNPNVFMVGDVKQSIYRFRHAKPELFLEKYTSYSINAGEKQRKILLYKNFRSRKNIIDVVNFIFSQIMSAKAGEIDYDENEKLNPGIEYKDSEDEHINIGGAIELDIIELNNDNDEEEKSTDYMEENINKREYDEEDYNKIEIEAKLIADKIHTLMGKGDEKCFYVYDKKTDSYRSVQYKDIVILLRTTKDWSDIIRNELEAAGIPSYADTGTGYFDTVEIKTIMSVLQIIDNPMQDIPLLSVMRSPIYNFLPEELIDIRLVNKECSFYEAMEEYVKNNHDTTATKVQKFIKDLMLWRKKALYMSTDELIWFLYDYTNYYNFVAAMPGGAGRQANLRLLFERARQFENTTYKGLFNFIKFVDKLKTNRGDMRSAKILGENENVVRIMSIHKSKGLEFPVVIVAGMGKKFNMSDLNGKILYHQDMGYGPDYVDYNKRISYPTPVKHALKYKIRSEALSEEMRVLYVAFTRAKEKLIITGCVNDLKSSAMRWTSSADTDMEKLPEYEVMNGNCYLDWICSALSRHKDGEEIRKIAGINDERFILHDESNWKLKFKDRNSIINNIRRSKQQVLTDDIEKVIKHGKKSDMYDEVIRRLEWKYSHYNYTKVPVKVTVTELKRLINSELADEYAETIFVPSMIKKPRFFEKTQGLSAAEKGTVLHFVMQHLDFNNINGRGISNQIEEMVRRELLTREQAQSVNVEKIQLFFSSDLGQRMINADNVYREIPFCIEVNCNEIYPSLCMETETEDTVLLQGAVDCCFEEKNKIILIDFKTDYVPKGNEDKIKQMYEVQIMYYAEAISQIFCKPVDEKYIYLFWNNKSIVY